MDQFLHTSALNLEDAIDEEMDPFDFSHLTPGEDDYYDQQFSEFVDLETPDVQTEHSYSMNDNDFFLKGLLEDQELDQETLTLINPNLAMMSDSAIEETEELLHEPLLATMKTELMDSDFSNEDEDLSAPLSDSTSDSPVEEVAQPQPRITLHLFSNPKFTSSHPTIIVTKVPQPMRTKMLISKNKAVSNSDNPITSHNTMQLDLSQEIKIKTEDDGLPPSPPNSDSEASLSPQRTAMSSFTHTLTDFKFSQERPMIRSMSTNTIPSSDVLVLTEEEKRTLIAEGYPVPTKLPLSKQEEKALKKIQRKIKNKMSAQESRRKKKDYLESLEKRLQASHQENGRLKQKMDVLESNNRSLVSQLHKLQQIVGSYSVQKSTIVMAVVFFFAIFLGTFSMDFTHGANSLQAMTLPSGVPVVNDYNTPSKQSRVLLSFADDQDLDSTHQITLFEWFSIWTCKQKPVQSEPHTTPLANSDDDVINEDDVINKIAAVNEINVIQNVKLETTNETVWKQVSSFPDPDLNFTYTSELTSIPV